MESILRLSSLSLSLSLWLCADSAPLFAADGVKPNAGFRVTERGPHHRVWTKVILETNALGSVEVVTNSYTELATGLHYLQDDQWRESKEELELVAGGAVARQGQHKVRFAANLATVGAIEMELPDGQRLRSHVLGLRYFDASSRKSVWIAQVKDTVGELQSPQTPGVLLYPNAFTDLKADVRLTYTRAGLEQDIILRERPPRVELYSLNPATTTLQVWTEVLDAPPVKRSTQTLRLKSGGELTDETLDFSGTMQIGRGRAFALGDAAGESEAVVTKQWVTVDGRTCLVEEIALPEVRKALEALPRADGAAVRPAVNGLRHAVTTEPSLPAPPARRLARTSDQTIQLAQTRTPEPGFVLDYVILNTTQSEYLFKGSTTYLIGGPVNVTTATLEGAAVLKYAKDVGAKLTVAALNCQTAPGRPAIFTASDDNTVGENIGGSTGNPTGYYANPALEFTANPPATWCLTNFRVAYAQQAISASSVSFALVLEHGQIVHCSSGVRLPGQGSASLRNVLIADVGCALYELAYANITAQHVTFAGSADFPYGGGILGTVTAGYPTVTVNLKNCILARMHAFLTGGTATLSGEYNGFFRTPPAFGSGSETHSPDVSPFVEDAGAGDYYLDQNSGFQDKGWATLDPGLAEALSQRTTSPPITQASQTWTTDQTFCRRAIRDDNGALNLGFHYEAVDYIFHDMQTTKTVRLEGGVAIGVQGSTTGWGLKLLDGGNLDCVGAPCAMNRIVSFQNVQESPPAIPTTGYTARPGNVWIQHTSGTDANCRMVFRFTDIAMGQGCSATVLRVTGLAPSYVARFAEVSFQDCRVRGGVVLVLLPLVNAPRTVRWVNNIWERATARIVYSASANPAPYNQYPVTVDCRNNLFRDSYLLLIYQANNGTPGIWEIKDNLFDQSANVAMTDTQGAIKMQRTHNASTATVNNLGGSWYQTGLLQNYLPGPLGDYYYPPSGDPPSLASLINAGSRTALAAELPCATTQVDESPDADTVDIGFHYPIQASSCEPLGARGIMVNLLRDPVTGYLRITPTADTSPMPFVNLANSGRGTVARIEIPNQWNPSLPQSKVVGEYYTAPSGGGRGRNPSRTTVDRYGNVWVGNRAEGDGNGGSIAQIGVVVGGTRGNKVPADAPWGQYTFTPAQDGQWIQPPSDGSVWYSTCPDKDGDGLIRTSAGLHPSGSTAWILAWDDPPPSADTLGGVSKAVDEAIVRYVRVFPTAVRSLAVDGDNNVWVGSSQHPTFSPPGNSYQEFVDGRTGMPVTGRKFRFGSGGYGGLVDGYGVLWSPGYEVDGLLRFLPDEAQPPGVGGGIIPLSTAGYGIGIDPKTGDVWAGNYGGGIQRFTDSGCRQEFPTGGTIRGIVVDGEENVWVAQSLGTVVFRLRTTGELIGAVSVSAVGGNNPYGLCIDPDGMIWAVCYNGYAVRIDPHQNPPGDPPTPVAGRAVEAVYLGNYAAPYNYSDMSGFVTLAATQPAGFWDFVEDSAAEDTLWTKVATMANAPANTGVRIEVRAASRVADLPSWPFHTVGVDGTIPSGMKGRYLEVRATLLRAFCPGGTCAGPELQALCVTAGGTGSSLSITRHPANQGVTPGAPATFEVVASGATSYQWFKDGIDQGVNASALTLSAAQYSDAGSYFVRVADGAGTVLDSAVARLHIKGNAPAVPTLPAMTPVSPNPGDSVTLTASTTVTPASIPPAVDEGYQLVSWQWRFGHTPLAASTGVGLTASLTLPNVQCVNAGDYSVVFWNAYGEVLSPTRTLALPGSSAVTISATIDGVPATPPVTVQHENQRVILTANYCFQRICAQWYFTPLGGAKTMLLGANGDSYEIPGPIECSDRGTYTFEVIDAAWGVRAATATVNSATPTLSMASVTLELNPTGGGTWTDYHCEESTDGGWTWAEYGAQGQNWLVMPTDGGEKNGRRYRITAQQGDTTASATGSLESSDALGVHFKVRDVQNGTADVKYTASNPVGIGPWTYHWFKQDPITSEYVLITAATGSSYEITTMDCTKQGSYRITATDACLGSAEALAQLSTTVPSLTMQSLTLELNPSGGGTWTDYHCEESTDGGENWDVYGPQLQNWLIIPTDGGQKNGRWYRITAQQGGTTASVTGRLDNSAAWSLQLTVMDVQTGTTDVKFTGASPMGVGPWAYRWFKDDVEIEGAYARLYEITGVDCSKQGTYRLEVSDNCDQTATVDAYLFRQGCPP